MKKLQILPRLTRGYSILFILAMISGYFSPPFGGMVGGCQTFQKTWGGVWADIANDIAPTSDSNFVITGLTYNSSLSCNNILLMKIDTMGDTLWTRVYGASGGQTGWRVIQTYDGGYAIAAHAAATNMHDNIMLIKTDGTGNLLWYKMYGGIQADGYSEFLETPDSGYLFAADTRSFGFQPATCNDSDANSCYSHIYLIRTDKNGDTLWTKVIYTNESEAIYSITLLKDSNYLIAGATSSFTNSSAAFLIKIDASGNLLWSRAYPYKFTEARGVIEKENGNLIVMGNGFRIYPNLFTLGIILAETDSAGNLKWMKITNDGNDTNLNNETGYVIKKLKKEGYIIDCTTQNWGDSISIGSNWGGGAIIKLDTLFNIQWQKTYGGGGDWNPSMAIMNKQIIIAGTMYSYDKGNGDVYIISPDSNGNTGCLTWDMNLSLLDIDTATITEIDTGFVVGNTNTIVVNYPLQQGYPQLEMMDCDSFVGIAPPSPPIRGGEIAVYPNPVSDEFWVEVNLPATEKITIELYDIMGSEIISSIWGMGQKGEHFIQKFKTVGLGNGVYFIKATGASFSQVKRVAVVR